MFDYSDRIIGEMYPMHQKAGDFGVELELEGRGFPAGNPMRWRQPERGEGSLRGEGREYFFAEPQDMDGLIRCMDGINNWFQKHGTVINEGAYRASTHIHLNMQKEKFIDVLGTLVVFTILEPVILRLCGPTRDGNLFCMSSYDTGDLHAHVHELIENVRIYGGGPHRLPQRGKYATCNTNPLTTFGSLEFRCFPSTTDARKVVQWAGWVDAIRQKARDCQDKSFYPLFLEAKRNPFQFAKSILQEQDLDALVHPMNLYELVQLGCEQAYELVHIIIRAKRRKDKNPKKTKLRGRAVRPHPAFELDDFLEDEPPEVIPEVDDGEE